MLRYLPGAVGPPAPGRSWRGPPVPAHPGALFPRGKSAQKDASPAGWTPLTYLIFISFALHLRSVLSKPFLLPCMRFCGYFHMSPRGFYALVQGLIGCVGRFVLVQLRSAPFHYAGDRWFYSRGEGAGASGREFSQGVHWDAFFLDCRPFPEGERWRGRMGRDGLGGRRADWAVASYGRGLALNNIYVSWAWPWCGVGGCDSPTIINTPIFTVLTHL